MGRGEEGGAGKGLCRYELLVSSKTGYGIMCLRSRRKRLERLIATLRVRTGWGREEQDQRTWCSSRCTKVTD